VALAADGHRAVGQMKAHPASERTPSRSRQSLQLLVLRETVLELVDEVVRLVEDLVLDPEDLPPLPPLPAFEPPHPRRDGVLRRRPPVRTPGCPRVLAATKNRPAEGADCNLAPHLQPSS